jgi:hypothetical protein
MAPFVIPLRSAFDPVGKLQEQAVSSFSIQTFRSAGLPGASEHRSAKKNYFEQVKRTGILFDSFSSGEVTFSCSHSSTVFPRFPSFHV